MSLYTWYMERAIEMAMVADMLRDTTWLSPMAKGCLRQAQDDCATYVTLANQAAERYGA